MTAHGLMRANAAERRRGFPHVLTAPIVDKKIRPGTKSFRKDHAKIARYSCPAFVEASATEQAHRRPAPCQVMYLQAAAKYKRPAWGPSRGQTVLCERALMTS